MKKSLRPPLRRDDPLLEKFHFLFISFVRFTLILALGRAIFSSNWSVFLIILGTFLLTFLAALIETRYKIDIPIEFEIGLALLVYGSIFLGEVNGYYTLFWWWDLMLHTLTGIIVGFVGFLTLYVLYKRKRVRAAPFIIAIFSFSFAAAIGGVWEIFEFGMDQLFGLNMQKSGLRDTMWDLIVNNVGALLGACTGYLYLRTGETPVVSHIVNRFKKENPTIAKKLPKKSI